MKKSLAVLVILNCSLMSNIFAQSVLLTPDKIGQTGGTLDNISLRTFNGGIPNIIGINHGGTLLSPSSTSNNTTLLGIDGAGFSTFITSPTARIVMLGSENWSNTANGTGILFNTTANGTTSIQERMRINHNGFLGIGLTSPDKILDINGRMRIRHTPGFTSGIWMSNSTNGLTDADGAFFGMENDNKAGIWINNAWRFGVNNSGEISTTSMVGSGSRMVLASPTGVLSSNFQPQVWSIAAGAFSSESASSANFIKGANVAYFSSGTSAAMFTPVNLPTGVTISEIKVFYQDNSSNSMSISFREQNLQNDSGGGTTLGNIGTFTSTNVTGIQSANLNLAGATTIDNANRAYYLEAASSNWSGLRIHSIKITYSY